MKGTPVNCVPSIRTFEQSVQLLQEGEILIYPTETFFAVGCSMFSQKALEQVFFSKNRPSTKPLPLLAASVEQIERIALLTPHHKKLGQQCWPGPLTLLCEARPCVPECITAGTGKVAVRISSHATALALAKAMDGPLVCSSANISGEAPPRVLTELSPMLLSKVQSVLMEGAEPSGGLPSTIVEVRKDGALLIRRKGAKSHAELEALGWDVVAK